MNFHLSDKRIAIVATGMAGSKAEFFAKTFSGAQHLEVFPDLASDAITDFDLIVLQGEMLRTLDPAILSSALEFGTPRFLVVLDPSVTDYTEVSSFLGVGIGSGFGIGEWFIKPIQGEHQLPNLTEFPANGSFLELSPLPGSNVLAAISVGFADRVIFIQNGATVICSFDPSPTPIPNSELQRLLRRACFPVPVDGQKNLVVGIVGYGAFGGMGHYHGAACQAIDGLALGAIAEPNETRRESALKEFPGTRAYASASDLFEDPEIQVVIIATPPSTHYELARAALEAGKHVILEKPMCLTSCEADSLMEVAKDASRVLTVHQNRRFDPDFLTLVDLIDSGALGEIFNVETFVGGFEHPCRAWHSEERISGGAAYDWGSHHIDWILQLLGSTPTELFVNGHKRVWHDITNLDQVRIKMAFSDGREAEFIQSDIAAKRRPKFYVQGTKGTAVGYYDPVVKSEVSSPFGFTKTEFHHAEAPVSFEVSIYHGPGKTHEWTVAPKQVAAFAFHQNLVDHIVFGDSLAVTPESVRPVIEILEVAHNLSTLGEHFAKL